jgi:hypothetical protein
MAWPKHFPEGCPPASIPDVHGEAFRLLLGTKVTPREMKSHGEKCTGCPYCSDVPVCQRVALSVRATLQDALAYLRAMPRFRAIALAALEPPHGKMTQTGEDTKHFSLWLKEESLADARNLFAVVHVNPETEEPK